MPGSVKLRRSHRHMSSRMSNHPVPKRPYRILMVTGVYPTDRNPHSGTFIKTKVDALTAAGLEVEVIHPTPGPVPIRYAVAALQVFFKTLRGHFDIVQGHYGL